ncbi:hypothetical protein [Niabella hibiscisoli]|uniref:hypothetical protein n=1 Tax=Niabella hibiscisoli TaxID=1825928 RepID=UPI001F0F4BB4|nr:hypothetical protein [Niabella hibiscisoli]MCH5718091.1 hypothetical protein [Niabella hibiscisoli]
MKLRKLTLILFSVLSLAILGCNNDDKKNDTETYTREVSDTANVAAIMHGFDAKDTTVIGAYLEDKSTITINDIDPKDTTYSTRSKVLYKAGPDGKALAIVYGYKTNGKGMAVVQKVGEKPFTLKEGEMEGNIRNYSDGTNRLQKADQFAFLNDTQYEEIR